MPRSKRLGIDMDGVMADFISSFSALAYRLGYVRTVVSPEQCESYDWFDQLMTKEQSDLVWNVLQETPNWWMTLRPLVSPSEVNILNDAMRRGVPVVFLTARRGRTTGLSTVQQTEAWLRGIGIDTGKVENIIASRKKGNICAGLDLDAFLDDKPDNLAEIEKNGAGCLAVSRRWPYNKEWGRHVFGVGEFIQEYA